ncbi:hypothetical protein N9Y63_05805 [Akkermansiaceae bacterium]|nr:hypothetical protein [Akkermansiaceae bacterium]
MEIWKAIIVGIVQGLAEFLPVSSSGHIVLTQYLLGIRDVGAEHRPDLSFEIILHLGTLVSVLIFFRKSLWSLILSLFNNEMREERMMIVWLGVATVPAVVAALLFKDYEPFINRWARLSSGPPFCTNETLTDGLSLSHSSRPHPRITKR